MSREWRDYRDNEVQGRGTLTVDRACGFSLEVLTISMQIIICLGPHSAGDRNLLLIF